MAPIQFGGRIVMVGCGSIGQAILPLLRRHFTLAADHLIVLAADEVGRVVAQEHDAQFFYAHLKPRSFRRILGRHLRRGDLLLNVSVDVSSLDLMTFAAERGALYVDTSIEPWPGVFDNPMLDLVRDPSQHLVAFAADAAGLRAMKALGTQKWDPDVLALTDKAAYLWCEKGILASRLAPAFMKACGDAATTRNWATVLKLHALTETAHPEQQVRRSRP